MTRNNDRRHQSPILGPEGLPPGAMEMAQQAAMQEAKAAQQQMHLQMLHQSTMREAYIKFIAYDNTELGLNKAANKAFKAAAVFMKRLGVDINIAVPDLEVEKASDVI